MNGKLQPFERGVLPIKPREFIREATAAYGISRRSAKDHLRRLLADEVWMNDEYQVNIDKSPEHGFRGMTVWHLSIKRRDRSTIHDWRDLQAIKNKLVGPEAEAVELYPAESRLVDTANQYHLWCFVPGKDGKAPRIPLGWMDRAVSSESEHGAVQRPLEAA